MNIESIKQTGLEGFQRGAAKVAQHSQEIAAFDGDSLDSNLVDSIVGLKQGEYQTYAASKVLKTYDSLTKTVLSLFA